MNRLARRTVSVLAALAVGVSLAWAASVHDTASPVPSATTDAPVPSSTTAPTPTVDPIPDPTPTQPTPAPGPWQDGETRPRCGSDSMSQIRGTAPAIERRERPLTTAERGWLARVCAQAVPGPVAPR